MARYLWNECWHWWPPTCAARFWRLARTARIVERASRKYSRIFDESKQRREYVFRSDEWCCNITVNADDVSTVAVRACPKEGWVDVYILDADGHVRITDGQMVIAHIVGHVVVTDARRFGGISDLAAVDG